MKVEGKLFAYGCGFYIIVAAIYGFWARDEAGVILLLFTGLLAFLVAFFILHTARRVYPRPEDREDAFPDEADIDYGFYSPHSWWPMPVAGAAALIALGLVFAAWMVVAGVVFMLLSLVGFVFEYYRGDHAH